MPRPASAVAHGFPPSGVRATELGETFGDFTVTRHGYRGVLWLQCAAGHEIQRQGGQLRADKRAGLHRPKCRECRAMGSVGEGEAANG